MAEAKKSTKTTEQDKPAAPPRSLAQFKTKVEAARGGYTPYVLPIGDDVDTGAGVGNVVITDPWQIKGHAVFGVLQALGRVAGGEQDMQALAAMGELPSVVRGLMSDRDFYRLVIEQEVSGLVLLEILLDMARHYGIDVPEGFDLGELLASLS